MKLKADRATLIKALAHVQSVVERRNTIPILANVMIAVRDGRLTLTATDMEIAIVEDVPAEHHAQRRLHRARRDPVRDRPPAAGGAEVELDHPGGDAQLALRAGRYATSLVVLPAEDFPSMNAGTLPHKFHLPAVTLRGLIDRTRFAISTEETRYYLNGIYLHVAEGEGGKVLRAVATDGHRLARVEEPLPEGAAAMPGVIIPRKTVAELRKLLDEHSGEVEVALSDTRIQFHAGAGAADQQADRRHLSGIRARHPARQRQGAACGEEGFLRRGGARGGDLVGAVPPGEAVAGARPAGAVGGEPRPGHRDARNSTPTG